MKKNSIITLSFLSCSKNDREVDNAALATKNLAGTYSPDYVSLDGDDITSDFTGFTLAVDESFKFYERD